MDIGIDLIPFNRVKENFNMKIFYTVRGYSPFDTPYDQNDHLCVL